MFKNYIRELASEYFNVPPSSIHLLYDDDGQYFVEVKGSLYSVFKDIPGKFDSGLDFYQEI